MDGECPWGLEVCVDLSFCSRTPTADTSLGTQETALGGRHQLLVSGVQGFRARAQARLPACREHVWGGLSDCTPVLHGAKERGGRRQGWGHVESFSHEQRASRVSAGLCRAAAACPSPVLGVRVGFRASSEAGECGGTASAR